MARRKLNDLTWRNRFWIALLPVLAGIFVVMGQDRPRSVRPISLYVFDMGTLKSANPQLKRGITMTDISVSALCIHEGCFSLTRA
jgi:hypothetical protein